jgi:hypothetical protein
MKLAIFTIRFERSASGTKYVFGQTRGKTDSLLLLGMQTGRNLHGESGNMQQSCILTTA